MRIQREPIHSVRALTRTEVLVIVSVLFLLLALLLPAISHTRSKSKRISCVGRLGCIGVAFRIFATDHTNAFPTAISTNLGGTKEFATAADVWRHFLALSNELSAPQLVYCPSDKQRRKATNWQNLGNQNVSYFVSLNATENDPNEWLAGDRNLESNGQPLGPGAITLTTNVPLAWGKNMHKMHGHILQSDGSVQQLSNSRLGTALINSGIETNRLAFP